MIERKTVLRQYRYKLRPNRKQRLRLEETLDICRELYNLGLEQRHSQRIGRFAQMRQLTEIRQECAEYKNVHVHVLQNVVKQLDNAFKGFFRRCKNGDAPGYPRFKSKDRYDTFRFNNVGFALNGNQLSLSKIGNIKLRLSRELPKDAVVKVCTVTRSASGWFAVFTFEREANVLPYNDSAIGIDMGIENYAALSDGTMIPNPRFYETGQKYLRAAQRRVARRKKGSNRKRIAAAVLRKVYQRINNRRMDFLHKHSARLVQRYGTIVVEKLNIIGLAQGDLSKQVYDASWTTFFNFLSYKAAEAGRTVIGVDPKYTSQTCPACGAIKKKSLRQRTHNCPCGYQTHRDTAAAQVILARAEPSNVKIEEIVSCLV